MAKKPTFLGKDPDDIRHFLEDGIADESGPSHSNSLSEQLLCDYLAESFPPASLQLERSSAIVERLHSIAISCSSKTVREILTDPQTDVGLLRMVKEHYKEKESKTKDKPEGHAATVVYFAAIAHALLLHDEKITEYSKDQLGASLAALEKKPWITPQLQKLFGRARELCR